VIVPLTTAAVITAPVVAFDAKTHAATIVGA
jgi:hypothetical protein